MSRGPEFRNWIGIIATPTFSSIPLQEEVAQEICNLDRGFHSFGPARLNKKLAPQQLEPVWPTTGSEKELESILNEAGKTVFQKLLLKNGESKDGRKTRTSVRLSRILCYTYRKGSIDKHAYGALTEHGPTQGAKDFKKLVEYGFLKKKGGENKEKKGYTYERELHMFI